MILAKFLLLLTALGVSSSANLRRLQEDGLNNVHLHSHGADNRTTRSASLTDPEWDCNRTWPSLALFMPVRLHDDVHNAKYYEFENMFLRTFLLFWPLKLSNTSLVLGYDAELKDHGYLKELRQTVSSQAAWRVPGGISFVGMHAVMKHINGHSRQQYDMFWADNFTSPDTEYIGYVDTDAAFITYVDREDLFEDGKPVVNGGTQWHNTWDAPAAWASNNFNGTGMLEPFKCMSYFPVIVKRSHLAEIREWIRKYWGASTFDQAFQDHIDRTDFSQFGIFCIYMWNFRRDEYKWYIHNATPKWNGIDPPPTRGQDGNVSQFTADMKVPKPRIATHVAYRSSKIHYMPQIGDSKHYGNYMEFLRQGYCYSPPFPKAYGCGDIDPLKYHFEMHNFDYISYEESSDKAEMDRQAVLRHQRLAKCDHHWEEWETSAFVQKPKQ